MTFRRAFVLALVLAACCRVLSLGAFYYHSRGTGFVAMPPDHAYLATAVLDTFDPMLWPERVVGGVPRRMVDLTFGQVPGPLSVWGPHLVGTAFSSLVWAVLLAPVLWGAGMLPGRLRRRASARAV
jgi:hypothetical protein